MRDDDIVDVLLRRAELQSYHGELWLTPEEWARLLAHLDVPSKQYDAGATIFGVPIRISIDYLTEVVKEYLPREEAEAYAPQEEE